MRLIAKWILFTGASAALAAAQQLGPAVALDRYLDAGGPADAAVAAYTIRIDASLPRLKKHASASGIRLVSATGQVVYRSLRFTGDKLVKTDVIARFLTRDSDPTGRIADPAVARANYAFIFTKTSDYNGTAAYVFHLKPKRKRSGFFIGELWLDRDTGAPLRLWGDFVKSPSLFMRQARFVEDYRNRRPARLLLTAEIRLAGQVEMAVWTDPVAPDTEATDSDSTGKELESQHAENRDREQLRGPVSHQ